MTRVDGLIQTIETYPNKHTGTGRVPDHLVTYLGHATMLIELDGIRILTDPLLRRRTAHLRRSAIRERRSSIDSVDAVIISHMHFDHLDLPSLRMLPVTTPIFGPTGSREILHAAGMLNVTEVSPGDIYQIGPVALETTSANHDGDRPLFGPRGEAVGFVVRGSHSYYFAGDTDLFDEMVDIGKDLDVALLPVWGWGPTLGPGHLDPDSAAEALKMLQPRFAVPIHWGTLCPIGMKWIRPRFLTEPPREFVRAANQQAPDVDVRVLHPGGCLDMNRVVT